MISLAHELFMSEHYTLTLNNVVFLIQIAHNEQLYDLYNFVG